MDYDQKYESASRRRLRFEHPAMLRRLFMRTTLGKRIAEAHEAYRDLKIAEHRSALRIKRASVRGEVMAEINRQQLERLQEHKIRLLQLAKLQAKRADQGITVTTPPRAVASKKTAGNKAEEKFKADVVSHVARLIPEKARNALTGRVINEVVSDAVKGSKIDAGSGSMAAQMVASIAIDTDMKEKDLVELVDTLQWESDEVKEEVKRNVLNQLEKVKATNDTNR